MAKRGKTLVVVVHEFMSEEHVLSLLAAIGMFQGVVDVSIQTEPAAAPPPPPVVAAEPAVSPESKLAFDNMLLTAAEAAAERNQGLSTFWRDVKAGIVPAAYYIGSRSPRWRRSEIRADLEESRRVRMTKAQSKNKKGDKSK